MTKDDPLYKTLELPKPHSHIQRILMQAMLTPGLVELWCCAGTKFGKTLALSSGVGGAAWVKKNGLYRWIAPVYSQAKIGFKYHNFLLPTDGITTNKSDPSVTITHTGTKIEYRSGKHPEDLEGEATQGNCLDEAAKMQRQVYDSVKTTTTVTRGPIMGFSTPKGKGWFFDKCMEAKAIMEHCLAKGEPPTHIFLTAPSMTNPAVTQEAVLEAKRTLPDRLFRQYYMAEFIDDGSTFVNFRQCAFPVQWDADAQGQIHKWFHQEADECEVVIGVDWAKKQDYTVFIAIDMVSTKPMVVGYTRFQGLSYTEAIKQLMIFSRRFNKTLIVRHDITGVGEAINDMLSGSGLPFEGVVFTNASKSSMVSQLMLTFEREEIVYPNIPEIVYELDIYEVKTTSTGAMQYAAPVGMHDDIVSAFLLANSGAQERRGGLQLRFLEDLPKEKLTIDKFYRDMMQQIEDEGYG